MCVCPGNMRRVGQERLFSCGQGYLSGNESNNRWIEFGFLVGIVYKQKNPTFMEAANSSKGPPLSVFKPLN